jgi:hypothetical protein
MFDLRLSLQLNISSSRDKNHRMDDWLKDEIAATRKRRERRERKLARRGQDAQIIERDKVKFWESLYVSLQAAVKDFNDSGACDDPVTIDAKDGYLIYVRTPGYPHRQLVLELHDKANSIGISLGQNDDTISRLRQLLSGTLDFDVDDDGNIMLRDNGNYMDVSQVTEYLLRQVLPVIYSGRY